MKTKYTEIEEKHIKKFNDIMEIAKKSKVDFYTSGGKRSMEVTSQKKPLEDFAYIISNLLILEKLDSIEKLLSKGNVEESKEDKEDESSNDKEEKKKVGRPATKK